MKTVNVATKRITIIAGIIMAILILLVFNVKADDHGDPEKDLRYKSELNKIEKAVEELAEFEKLEFEKCMNKKVFKFFDERENLLYQSEVGTDQPIEDEKLIKYLHQSDLVMNMDHTSFYRFNK